ncbi:hypothetical protein Avbf_03650 [Armadillidium vulgare]|nr:hypothetical protein Avbf_03650 [Armadillidium vulgare]
MKRKSSPVFKSLKCSNKKQINHNVRNKLVNVSDSKTECINPIGQDETESLLRIFASTSDTQGSNLTTQDTQPFKARLEKKFSIISQNFDKQNNEEKSNHLEISFEYCSPSNVDIGPFFGLPTKVRDFNISV